MRKNLQFKVGDKVEIYFNKTRTLEIGIIRAIEPLDSRPNAPMIVAVHCDQMIGAQMKLQYGINLAVSPRDVRRVIEAAK